MYVYVSMAVNFEARDGKLLFFYFFYEASGLPSFLSSFFLYFMSDNIVASSLTINVSYLFRGW